LRGRWGAFCCWQCVPIMFPMSFQHVFQVSKMFPIAPHFYPILFFSYGVQGNGGFLFFLSVFPIMFPSMWLRKKNKKIKPLGNPWINE
jgi:hypothetical protein